MKWISLMLWAGANPRSLGSNLDERYGDDPECFTTALKEASYSGNVEVLKKLKPDPKQDDLSDLLHCAAVSARTDAIKYVLEVGANPNDKPNGGSSALDTCLWQLEHRLFSVLQRESEVEVRSFQGTGFCARISRTRRDLEPERSACSQ